jgi:hypothetical protein
VGNHAKTESRKQKAEGRRQKAEGRRQDFPYLIYHFSIAGFSPVPNAQWQLTNEKWKMAPPAVCPASLTHPLTQVVLTTTATAYWSAQVQPNSAVPPTGSTGNFSSGGKAP